MLGAQVHSSLSKSQSPFSVTVPGFKLILSFVSNYYTFYKNGQYCSDNTSQQNTNYKKFLK